MLSPPVLIPNNANLVSLRLLRLDKLHLPTGGNKYFKLKYNLEAARQQNHQKMLTFGGAFSNHILATARAAQSYGFESIGIIRGEAHEPLNQVLQEAQNAGMQLHYLSRSDYRNKHTAPIQAQLRQKFGDFYQIPEGGTNLLALKGTAQIPKLLSDTDYDVLITPVGTGGTLAGLLLGTAVSKQLVGIAVLKGADFLNRDINQLLAAYASQYPDNYPKQQPKFVLQTAYHFGGYAKSTTALNNFVSDFYAQNQIPIEPIYTGKMLYAIVDLVQKGYFKPKTKLVALHTGGLDYLPSSD